MRIPPPHPLILSLLLASPATAGISAEEAARPEDLVCAAPRVVLARVDAVKGTRPTHGDPARVRIRVLRTLKGDAPPYVTERAIVLWRPRPHDVDWGGPSATRRLEEWRRQPYPGPEVGSKWILVFPAGNASRGLGPKHRHPATRERLRWIREAARCGAPAAPEEDAPMPDDPWTAVTRRATGSLRTCPDEWIQNRMPGPPPEPGSVGPPEDYFLLDGRRREIHEFDGAWLREHCHLEPQTVY